MKRILQNRLKQLLILMAILLHATGVMAQGVPVIGGSVYGGGKAANVNGNTNVTMTEGLVGSVYGGGQEGSVIEKEGSGGSANVVLQGGYVGYEWSGSAIVKRTYGGRGLANMYHGVYGGGYGVGTIVQNPISLTIAPNKSDVHINGSVYGGGECGQVNGGYMTRKDITSVNFTSNRANLFICQDGSMVSQASASFSPTAEYYEWKAPTYNTNGTAVTVRKGTFTPYVEGSVYGGGRGYFVSTEDATIAQHLTPDQKEIAGTVYGNTSVTIGSTDPGKDAITSAFVEGVPLYVPLDDAEVGGTNIYNLGNDEYQQVLKEQKMAYVWDVATGNYVQCGVAGAAVDVLKKDGTVQNGYTPGADIDLSSDVQYYLYLGAVGVVGGGECGKVRSNADAISTTAEGGNTLVTLLSGSIGKTFTDNCRLEGNVYGAGKEALIDGVSSVVSNGNVRVYGAVYGGGCMAPVLAYRRTALDAEVVGTSVQFTKGWARDIYGGGFMAVLGDKINSSTVIGAAEGSDDDVYVSRSVYAANGFSPHNGVATLVMNHGKIGFVKEAGKVLTCDEADMAAGAAISRPNNDLAGSLFGGGFGPLSTIKTTSVVMNDGIVKNAVFGGGQMGAVAVEGSDFTYKHEYYDGGLKRSINLPFGCGASTSVVMNGGTASMVYGGGCGTAPEISFAKSNIPGGVMGNTSVTIAGTAHVTNDYRDYDAGGASVYGGGMEGIVYGDACASYQGTHVAINGGEYYRVYGGGRGFMSSYPEVISNSETINDRVSRDAGWVFGDTWVETSGAFTITDALYGGGEGCYFGGSTTDTVAIVKGNTRLDLASGGVKNAYAGGRIASVYGYSNFEIKGTAQVERAFGGNDISGKVFGKGLDVASVHDTAVHITEGVSETYIAVTGNAKVDRVFGGGNGAYEPAAFGSGSYNYYTAPEMAYLRLTKPVQEKTYVDVYLDSTSESAHGHVGAAFAGGNNAAVGEANIYTANLGVCDTVFGGGNNATATSSVKVMVNNTTTNLAEGKNNVNYVFGGNNVATMAIVPSIELNSGRIGYVYGGGNAGAMTGNEDRTAHIGDEVHYLSTYVHVNSDNIEVTGAIYGGCNVANTTGGSLVDIEAGTINAVFGGNDLGGSFGTNTGSVARVDIGGTAVVTNVYGGGNGNYDYNDAKYSTYAAPQTDSTNVNIFGGTIDNVYGGGLAGDCDKTHLILDDNRDGSLDATINGAIFGAGCGNVAFVGSCADDHPHVGNVTSCATTDIKSVAAFNGTVYGGGNAGDVAKTKLTVWETFTTNRTAPFFDAIYGGCRASNVTETADTYIKYTDTAQMLCQTLYGGNDYGGTVRNTNLIIDGGKYYNVFGAGNGDYAYLQEIESRGLSASCYDTVPVSEDINMVINGGAFVSDVYGGANLGYVVKKTASNINEPVATAKARVSALAGDYAHINVTVHNGRFGQNIYTGARGVEQGRPERMSGVQLVYGLKQLNMDGGLVRWSIYGGSEAVDDGYPAECQASNDGHKLIRTNLRGRTTMRPSSILNVVGGEITSHVFGGGYRGNVYGSIYVNVGKDAVNDCLAWSTRYNNTANAYAAFKPTFDDPTSLTNLDPDDVYLRASIYNGANWGEAYGIYVFNSPGVFGGETRILIDGNGYNTTIGDNGTSDPFMDIHSSIIGAGTSVEGGDVDRNITLRNYGQYVCGISSKELFSIQRADSVVLENVELRFMGEQDAYMAYPSPSYSFCRTDTIIMKGSNKIAIGASAVYIGALHFRDTEGAFVQDYEAFAASALEPAEAADSISDQCSTLDFCDRFNIASPYTKLYIEDGMYFDVITAEGGYGEVKGYAYLLAQEGTQAFITARLKVDQITQDHPSLMYTDDGGFFSTCQRQNNKQVVTPGGDHNEFPYTNFTSNYRTWGMGSGEMMRKRAVTVVAHADVTQLDQNVSLGSQTVGDGGNATTTSDLAVAFNNIMLPPANAGHYYGIDRIQIDNDNGGQVILLSAGYKASYDPSVGEHGQWTLAPNSGTTEDRWEYLTGGNEHDGREILNDPSYTFGLMMKVGNNFSAVGCPTNPAHAEHPEQPEYRTCTDRTMIAGNNNVEQVQGFISKPITTQTNVIPTLEFYLTYSTQFANTILRDVKLTLMEYDDAGNQVAPIEITLTISTVIKDLRDDEIEMLAMYNEGYSDHYVRKIILPASMLSRDLYLKNVKWYPTAETVADSEKDKYFKLTNNDNDAAISTDSPIENRGFGFTLCPTEDITGSISTTLGWKEISSRELDIFELGKDGSASLQSNNTASGKTFMDNNGLGIKLGILDGRNAAALDVDLKYDGDLYYPLNDIVGHIELNFVYTDNETTRDHDLYPNGYGTYTITVLVRTRQKGDTIYIASAPSVTRGGVTVNAYNGAAQFEVITVGENQNKETLGKSPSWYVRSFTEALDPRIYQEGDVLCIIDPVEIGTEANPTQNIVTRGKDYTIVQMIRYSGSHIDLPGKECAFRGPMVHIMRNGQYSTYNMRINGSGCTRIKDYNTGGSSHTVTTNASHTYHDDASRVGDTVFANAPIFLVEGNGILTLNNNTTVLNNINMWDGDPAHGYPGGAIALLGSGANRPTARLLNNVTILDNAVSKESAELRHKPSGAGIHIDRGILELVPSGNATAVKITENYYVKNECTVTEDQTPRLSFYKYTGAGLPVGAGCRYQLDKTFLDGQAAERVPQKDILSNVFLTRTPNGNELNDAISDVVKFRSELPTGTRIGINKWFPGGYDHAGERPRDTIQFAKVTASNQLYAIRAREHANFVSDSSLYKVFFHQTLSPFTLYFQRCATFRKMNYQEGVEAPVLSYIPRMVSLCADGLDSVIYRVQGGFYPYTYTWESLKYADATTSPVVSTEQLKEPRITEYANDVVMAALRAGDSTYVKASNYDICALKDMVLNPTEADDIYSYRVTATDLVGCELTKYFEVKAVKTAALVLDPTIADDFVKAPAGNQTVPFGLSSSHRMGETDYSWTDTITGTDEKMSNHHARALHVYRGYTLDYDVQPVGSGSVEMTADDGEAIVKASAAAPAVPTLLCEGEHINLNAIGNSGKRFMMWDFDPNAGAQTGYTMTPQNTTIVAYFSPSTYWKDIVKAKPAGYTTDYNGDVHITSKEGLAWLISRVNGLNGQQPLPFYFKTVYVGSGDYDMGEYLWTPVGNSVERFRGRFVVDSGVEIKNIILNEDEMQYVGFFGHIDSADVRNLKLTGMVAHGAQYVGAVAATSTNNAQFTNCTVGANGDKKTLLSGGNSVAGFVAQADNTTVDNSNVDVKIVGGSLYAGGVFARGASNVITNTAVVSEISGDVIYASGLAAQSTSSEDPAGASNAKRGKNSRYENNYVHTTIGADATNAGGLVGYAENTILNNNYVYGAVEGSSVAGSLGGVIFAGVRGENNFYLDGTSIDVVGYDDQGNFGNYSSFSGSGNQVIMSSPVNGVNNLTRALNDWVRAQGDTYYRTWRSDLTGTENNGYPIFGAPDIIPVFDTVYSSSCDFYEWKNILLTESGTYSYHQTDSTIYVDSVTTLVLTINESMESEINDSVLVGESYNNYGFYLTEEETQHLSGMVDSMGFATLELVDSLLTVHGCDSVVVLTLTVYKSQEGLPSVNPSLIDVKVYPNPTRSMVNVEANGLTEVEVYDHTSRRIADREVYGTDKVQLDLSNCSSGAYYLRVKTTHGTVVKKVIKK